MISFKILYVDKPKKIVHVTFGPIKFIVQVIERDGQKPLVLKPTSIFIDSVDFYALITAVRSAWHFSD